MPPNERETTMRTDEDFFRLARTYAENQSEDPDTQVACIITDQHGFIVAKGANRLPLGACRTTERKTRPEKYKWIEHAERNAIYAAAREGTRLRGCIAYLPWFPCVECARALVQAGIATLVCHEPDMTDHRWGEDFTRALALMQEAGVTLRYVPRTVG